MQRHDFGFALTLVLLLIAPGIPVGAGYASLGAVGLAIWFCLSSRLPLLLFQRMPSLLGLIAFSIYALFVSMASTEPGRIVYAAQFMFYVLAGAMLLPAYLQDRHQRAGRILSVIGAIYCTGLVVSLWTGPIYPWQSSGWHKAYGELDIPRGIGFSESPNVAGGIAAIFACFAMFAYRGKRDRTSLLLVAVTIAGTIATMSRSAVLALLTAMLAVALLVALRPLLGAPMGGRLAIRSGALAMCAAIVISGVIAGSAIRPAAERMFLDGHHRANDISLRLYEWNKGIDQWADRDGVGVKAFGAGFRSGGFAKDTEIYATSHNAYLEALLDFGAIGLMLFGVLLLATMVRFTGGILVRPKQRLLTFAFSGMVVLLVHNVSQVFFWTPDVAVLMILMLTCGALELSTLRQIHWADSEAMPAVQTHGRLW